MPHPGENVNVRVAALGEARPPELASAPGEKSAARSRREARFGDARLEAEVVRGLLGAAETVEGPAICELPETTVVVPPGWRGTVDRLGTLALERT